MHFPVSFQVLSLVFLLKLCRIGNQSISYHRNPWSCVGLRPGSRVLCLFLFLFLFVLLWGILNPPLMCVWGRPDTSLSSRHQSYCVVLRLYSWQRNGPTGQYNIFIKGWLDIGLLCLRKTVKLENCSSFKSFYVKYVQCIPWSMKNPHQEVLEMVADNRLWR